MIHTNVDIFSKDGIYIEWIINEPYDAIHSHIKEIIVKDTMSKNIFPVLL